MDKYIYRYDLLGNKTEIEKQRRGLEGESGSYRYGYDPIGRLNEVTKDGNPLRAYQMNYGYDEFGQDVYEKREALQTFGYIGYQRDSISETYFAQAREYMSQFGRFNAEDKIRGQTNNPLTLNGYGYCWNNPIKMVDLDGKAPGSAQIDEWTKNNIGITLTDDEKILVVTNPKEALIVKQCQEVADEWTDKVFGKYYGDDRSWTDGDMANAYRHAMWNALLKQAFMSETNAKIWTDAHESHSEETLNALYPDNIHTVRDHTNMDLHNNQEGLDSIKWFEFWLSPKDISARILDKLKKGELVFIIEDSKYNELLGGCDE